MKARWLIDLQRELSDNRKEKLRQLPNQIAADKRKKYKKWAWLRRRRWLIAHGYKAKMPQLEKPTED